MVNEPPELESVEVNELVPELVSVCSSFVALYVISSNGNIGSVIGYTYSRPLINSP